MPMSRPNMMLAFWYFKLLPYYQKLPLNNFNTIVLVVNGLRYISDRIGSHLLYTDSSYTYFLS